MPTEILKKFRKIRNLSQQEMADILFMSQASYSKLESGKTVISLGILNKILSLSEDDSDTSFEFNGYVIISKSKLDLISENSVISLDNFYNYYKQVLDEAILMKNREIDRLNDVIVKLRKQLDSEVNKI
ncbi:MAG: hypothetical protein RL596_804 [Bacteroidota bacterium]|jgi:transcriptional regulator with XRE-family HTH domain